jgi:hypothetical protein
MLQTAAWAGPITGAPSTITPKPPVTGDCYYGGQRYSEGAVIAVGSGEIKCDRDRWVKNE